MKTPIRKPSKFEKSVKMIDGVIYKIVEYKVGFIDWLLKMSINLEDGDRHTFEEYVESITDSTDGFTKSADIHPNYRFCISVTVATKDFKFMLMTPSYDLVAIGRLEYVMDEEMINSIFEKYSVKFVKDVDYFYKRLHDLHKIIENLTMNYLTPID